MDQENTGGSYPFLLWKPVIIKKGNRREHKSEQKILREKMKAHERNGSLEKNAFCASCCPATLTPVTVNEGNFYDLSRTETSQGSLPHPLKASQQQPTWVCSWAKVVEAKAWQRNCIGHLLLKGAQIRVKQNPRESGWVVFLPHFELQLVVPMVQELLYSKACTLFFISCHSLQPLLNMQPIHFYSCNCYA